MPRPRGFRQSGPKRLVQWVGPAIQNVISVASGGATLHSFFAFEEKATIVRVHGQLMIKTSIAGNLNVTGAIGMAVVSDEAFLAGVGSIPEPFTDANWSGWFVWRSFAYDIRVADATGVVLFPWHLEIDSKAMRKVGPQETVVVIVESQAGAFDVVFSPRMLVKLS